jgi:hypothetical protein
MHATASTLRALLDPWDGVAPFVASRRWFLALACVCLATLASGAVWAWRFNPVPAVLQQLQREGELARATEQEISERVTRKSRMQWVAAVADGVMGVPVRAAALALVLALAAWVVGARLPLAAAWQVALLALLPVALGHLGWALAAARSPGLEAAQRDTLLPSHLGAWMSGQGARGAVLRAVDFFQLWGVGLMGLGLSAAASLRRWQGLVLAGVLFALYVGVFGVGFPGLFERMSEGGP